jgi:hypothetical protein
MWPFGTPERTGEALVDVGIRVARPAALAGGLRRLRGLSNGVTGQCADHSANGGTLGSVLSSGDLRADDATGDGTTHRIQAFVGCVASRDQKWQQKIDQPRTFHIDPRA